MTTSMHLPNESLTQQIGRWRKEMADGATGPLVIASEVVALSKKWEDLRAQAEGKDLTTWLRAALGPGKGLGYFRKRHEAVKRLGEAIRRTIHHEAAIWLADEVSDLHWPLVKQHCFAAHRKNNKNPVTKAQAIKIVAAVTGKKPIAKVCSRCEELENFIRANGLVVPTE